MDRFITFLLSVVISINLALGSVVLVRAQRNRKNMFFVFFVFSESLWAIAILGYYFFNFENTLTNFWLVCTHVTGLLISYTFICFTYYFPRVYSSKIKKFYLKPLPPLIVMIFLIVFTDSVVVYEGGEGYKTGFGYILYILNISLYFLAGFVLLLLQNKRSLEKSEKEQLLMLFFASVISASLVMVFDLFFPYFKIFEYLWLGPVFTLILILTTTALVIRSNLFDLRIFAAQVVVIILSVIVFLRVLLSRDLYEFFEELLLFVFVFINGRLLVWLIKNVTKRKEALEKTTISLKQANEELRALDATKSEFISIVSHQLRTPLTVIRGYVSLFGEGLYGKLTNKGLETVKSTLSSVDRLENLVESLLNLSRIESGRSNAVFTMEEISPIIDEVVRGFDMEEKRKIIDLNVHVPKNLPKVEVDRQKIEECISNLVDNAFKYTDEGSVDLSVKHKRKDGTILVSVKDTGAGISKSEIGSIFQKFKRGENTQKKNVNGVGIGLFIVRKFVEMHNGRIWLESEGEGKGTTFYIEIPITQPKKTATEDEAEEGDEDNDEGSDEELEQV